MPLYRPSEAIAARPFVGKGRDSRCLQACWQMRASCEGRGQGRESLEGFKGLLCGNVWTKRLQRRRRRKYGERPLRFGIHNSVPWQKWGVAGKKS